MEDQTVVLSAETDCSPPVSPVFLKLWECFPAQSCAAVSHLSMSLLLCLTHVFFFHHSPQSSKPPVKPSPAITLLLLLPTPSLSFPHTLLLIICTTSCPPAYFPVPASHLAIYMSHLPSCGEEAEPSTGSVLANTRFLLFMHTGIGFFIFFLSINIILLSQPSLLPILVHGVCYMILTAAYSLPSSKTPHIPLQYLHYQLFAAIFVILHSVPSLSC